MPPELGAEAPFIDLNIEILENVLGNLACVHLLPVFP
jgi:hypothetical protein